MSKLVNAICSPISGACTKLSYLALVDVCIHNRVTAILGRFGQIKGHDDCG